MSLRVAVFGQAAFGRDVLEGLLDAGHDIVGVYAPPVGSRPDPLAEEAEKRGLALFRHKRFRRKGEAIPELIEEYRGLGAQLNVMPFTTVILPPEIVDAPAQGSLCFHPSLLPRFRGGAAIPWQIILGELETGVTVFRPDEGVDTGPILVQRGGVALAPDDNAATLYFQKLYPLGIEAMAEAVAMVDAGSADFRRQDESRATFQGLVDDAVAAIDWGRSAVEIDRQIRGCDPQPGALSTLGGDPIRLYDGRLEAESASAGSSPGEILAARDGRLVIGTGEGRVSVGKVRQGEGGKVAAGDSPLRAGQRLG
jgi:methionyl-tRNA formyltransferase